MRKHNHFLYFLFTLLIVALVGCSSGPKKESAGEYFDDATITTKVKAAIVNDPDVKATQVKVETYKGVVQLSGFVDSQASASKAVEIARDVKGVKSVKNNMSIKQ
jgi:osmotically-inducible protein OsmY